MYQVSIKFSQIWSIRAPISDANYAPDTAKNQHLAQLVIENDINGIFQARYIPLKNLEFGANDGETCEKHRNVIVEFEDTMIFAILRQGIPYLYNANSLSQTINNY